MNSNHQTNTELPVYTIVERHLTFS